MKRKQADTLDKLLGKLYSAGFVVIPFHNLRECREIESVANVSLAPLCQLLEGETELTREQRIVLIATRSYKSSYAGVGNYRYIEAARETGISLADWERSKAECQQMGYLDKRGAITVDGRNVVGQTQLYELRHGRG